MYEVEAVLDRRPVWQQHSTVRLEQQVTICPSADLNSCDQVSVPCVFPLLLRALAGVEIIIGNGEENKVNKQMHVWISAF